MSIAPCAVASPRALRSVRPQVGFCIKTRTQDKNKVFINVCHHERVDKPIMTPSGKGQQWQLPNCLGPPRMEKDNSAFMQCRRAFAHSCTPRC